MRQAVLRLADDQPCDWKLRSVLDIQPGLWKMRNGHIAKVEKRIDIPYTDTAGKVQISPIWKGICTVCGDPHTWNVNGTFSPVGKSEFDLLVRL